MQPERVEKVKSLLASALSVPPAEREAFLANACAGDASLRRDVDSYLGVGDKTDQFFHKADTVPNIQISLENPSANVTAQLPSDPRMGRQFGRYVVRSKVAEGGMGIVYLALDTQLGREVALKILPEYFSMDRERLARFQREARATSLLNHPNIVTVFEIGQLDGCEFIVTEYVEGKTLRDLMRQGPIPFVEMLKIASQVAGALTAAHRAGVVHRDIKPENVMIRPDGYVKVLDFGLAKLTDATRKTPSGNIEFGPSGVNQTLPGVIMGTVSYMSPEQAEGLETDQRTDIWALGVILYEMVSGKVPFRGPTPSHTIVAILEQEPEKLPHASPEINQIIATALQKDRALRFQTAEAMSAAIDELKHRLGYISDQNVSGPVATVRSIATPTASAARGPSRRLIWMIPAAALMLLAGTLAMYAVVVWLAERPDTEETAIETPANSGATPEPTAEATPTVSEPTPFATPFEADVYAEPTPRTAEKKVDEQRESETRSETRKQRRVETPPERESRKAATPTPRPEPPKKTPPRKPKQDPNCVFTNSCT